MPDAALDVHVAGRLAGSLFRLASEPEKYHFRYEAQCPAPLAVSLTMPTGYEQYASDYRVLHPVFDMNLPEGALADRLRKAFSKVIPNFDAMALLKIVGKSQIGRLRFAMTAEGVADVPAENLNDLLTHDGAQDLFEDLLDRYAVHSGVSGAMPKVMVRDGRPDGQLGRVTHRGATHIVKAWTDEYPCLAENEWFCMRAALHAKLDVPQLALSKNGKFLLVERFDLAGSDYLGFEDFCVLNGKTASQKYDGSYENIAKRIRQFVSPEQIRPALENFFKALALSCALRNGDAHLKNFGVLYDNPEGVVRLAPIYDIVTTTTYKPSDILALTMGGTKRWPKTKILMDFARAHCNIQNGRAGVLMGQVAQGVRQAADEVKRHMHSHASFRKVGAAMLAEWDKGLKASIQP